MVKQPEDHILIVDDKVIKYLCTGTDPGTAGP